MGKGADERGDNQTVDAEEYRQNTHGNQFPAEKSPPGDRNGQDIFQSVVGILPVDQVARGQSE